MAKEQTRDAILAGATELFFKHGFRRVSIEDICRRAGVARKTFYDYFGNKSDAVIVVLDNYMDSITKQYLAIMDYDVSFSEKLYRIIDMKIGSVDSFSTEFMEDLLSPKSEELRGYFERKINENRRLAYSFYADAQDSGEIRSDISVDVIIDMQNHLLDLCRQDSFRAKFEDVQTMLRKVSELYLFGVVSNK